MLKKTLLILIFFLSACAKQSEDTSPASLLKMHAWYLSETRIKSYQNDSLTKDTTTASPLCETNSRLQFFSDNICSKYVICNLSTPEEKQGDWQLTSDSLLSANVLFKVSYGTGIIYKNVAIDQGKLIEINNDYFRIKSFTSYMFGSTVFKNENIYTYKRKQ